MENTNKRKAFVKKSSKGSGSKLIVFKGKTYDDLFDEFEHYLAKHHISDADWDIDHRVKDGRSPCVLTTTVIDLLESEEKQFHLHFNNYSSANDYREFLMQIITGNYNYGPNVKFCPVIEGGEIAIIRNELVVYNVIENENQTQPRR